MNGQSNNTSYFVESAVRSWSGREIEINYIYIHFPQCVLDHGEGGRLKLITYTLYS